MFSSKFSASAVETEEIKAKPTAAIRTNIIIAKP
jgi:hypothetical protein